MQKENIYVTDKSSLRDDRNLTKFDTLDEKISELVSTLNVGGEGRGAGRDGRGQETIPPTTLTLIALSRSSLTALRHSRLISHLSPATAQPVLPHGDPKVFSHIQH